MQDNTKDFAMKATHSLGEMLNKSYRKSMAGDDPESNLNDFREGVREVVQSMREVLEESCKTSE